MIIFKRTPTGVFLFGKSEFVGIMHNAKCIMHNYIFLVVGTAIGSPSYYNHIS